MKGIVFHGALGKFTWRMLATVLAGQGVVFALGALVARGIGVAEGDDNAQTWLWVGVGLAVLWVLAGGGRRRPGGGEGGGGVEVLGLAVLCFLAAGAMRRPWGVTLGWLIQVATFASALVVREMLGVGLVFAVLWVGSLVLCHRVEEQLAERDRSSSAG